VRAVGEGQEEERIEVGQEEHNEAEGKGIVADDRRRRGLHAAATRGDGDDDGGRGRERGAGQSTRHPR